MRGLNHPNIIQIRGCFEGTCTDYMVLDLMRGATLSEYMKLNPNLNHIQCQMIMKVNIFHLPSTQLVTSRRSALPASDLKPGNIMFANPDDIQSLKIIDFGLAVRLNDPSYQTYKCGTVGFVAPEVLNQKDSSQISVENLDKSDLFSLGVIMYKLQDIPIQINSFPSYTSKTLFLGFDQQDILKKNKECNICFSTLNKYHVPKEAQNLIQLLLKENPQDRISAENALKSEYFKNWQSWEYIQFDSMDGNDDYSGLQNIRFSHISRIEIFNISSVSKYSESPKHYERFETNEKVPNRQLICATSQCGKPQFMC